MTRFIDSKQNRIIRSTIKKSLNEYGINLLQADDKSYSDSLWHNVKAYMNACDLGIAIFNLIDTREFNPNISLELGYMMAKKKDILLLKEKHLEALYSDLVGKLYKTFDSLEIQSSLKSCIREWLKDIGIAKSSGEKLLLYVSRGGTCRCAIAKVVTQQLFKGRQLPFRLRVESIAYEFGDAIKASNGARKVIRKEYGHDHLKFHKVTHRNHGLTKDADLILVMEDQLREGFPKNKTYLLNEFFGLSGSVPDPWPDEENDKANKRYKKCLDHLKSTIKDNSKQILNYLNKMNKS